MVCDLYFPSPKIYNFKGIMCIYLVFLKNLIQMLLYFTY